ncbi:MAG TPA: ABC transporter permease [Gemmatimonadales bacterium]|jgi:predicted permease
MSAGWRRLLRIWRREPGDDVDAELQFHFDERVDDLVSRGMPAAAAAAQAVAEFGDLRAVRRDLVAIDVRVARRRGLAERWEWLRQDLGYVLRSLRRSPGLVVTVSVTLALGLGANVAIFSLLDRLFLEPPAGIEHPTQVHRIYRADPVAMSRRMHRAGTPASGIDVTSVFSYDDYAMLQRTLPASAALGGYSSASLSLGRGSDAAALRGQQVLGDLFTVLGVHAALGRLFQGDERRIEAPTPVVVLSDAIWRGRFGGRPDIVGQSIDLDYRQYTVIGVMPSAFRGPDYDAADLWIPMNMQGPRNGGGTWYSNNGTAWIRMLATTGGPGPTLALERAATLAFRQSEFIPDSLATGRVAPLLEAALPGSDRKDVAIATRLAGVAAIVLLIACANVTNLFLARGMQRRREIAMRLALGVSRRRLIALLLMESLVVSLVGAGIALAVAVWGAGALRHMLLPAVQWAGSAIDLRALSFTLVLAVACGLLAGLTPALRSSRPNLAGTLKGSAREGVFQRSRLRGALLVTQSALSVVLLAGAGLFVRSLHSMETEDIGYDAARIVFAQVDVNPDQPDRASEIGARLPAIAEELQRLPGVERVALARLTPMRSISWIRAFLSNGDTLPAIGGRTPNTAWVSADFFDTMGMRVLSGRGLTANDRYGAGQVLVVNQVMANAYWPGRSPIGDCLILDKAPGPCVPIVGVVSNAHVEGIVEQPTMQFYLPLADTGKRYRASVIALRTSPGRATAVASQIQQVLRAKFSGWAEPRVHTMSDDLAPEMRPWRTGAALFSAAGLLALLIAIVGIYSTISYTFSQRTHEIGVRVALGARATNVVRLVVGEGVRLVALGVLIGLGLTLASGKLIAAMLYRTSPSDPAVLGAVTGGLLLVAIAGSLIPAGRALRVDPIVALRAE